MSASPPPTAFFDWLDTVPRSPSGVLVRTPDGEVRNVPHSVFANEFRARRPAVQHPLLEQRRHRLAILTHQLEKENQ